MSVSQHSVGCRMAHRIRRPAGQHVMAGSIPDPIAWTLGQETSTPAVRLTAAWLSGPTSNRAW